MMLPYKKPQRAHWNQMVDRYLNFVESMHEKWQRGEILDWQHHHTRRLLHFTAIGLFVTFILVLVSCTSPQIANAPKPQILPPVYNSAPRGTEPLYIKRQRTHIKPIDSGSTSGSLYADTASPLNLFQDQRPQKPGDVIRINIPTEVTNKSENEKPNPKSPLPKQDLKSFPMEVVNRESDGSLYLKGEQVFQDSPQGPRKVTVYARLPSHAVAGFETSASGLTHIALTEERGGEVTDYASTGWDATTTRRLSGFAPDIEGELKALEGARSEVEKSKKDIEDRLKNLNEEKDRLKKDRERLEKSVQERMQRVAQSESAGAAASKPKAGENQGNNGGNNSPGGQPKEPTGQPSAGTNK